MSEQFEQCPRCGSCDLWVYDGQYCNACFWPSLVEDDVAAELLEERRRQVSAEGFSWAHDDAQDADDLAQAAACYAACALHDWSAGPPMEWPWAECWWKPSTARRDLVKAGALIIAAIERLDRGEKRVKQKEART